MLPLIPLLGADALALELSAPTRLEEGHLATFTVEGGTPGQDVGLVYGGRPPGSCPPILGGVCLDVSAPTLVAAGTIGPDGAATLQVSVPLGSPLVDLRFQAAEVGGSPSVSPVRVVPVLTELTAPLYVNSAADLALAQRAWRVGELHLLGGAWPQVVSLPHLERATAIVVRSSRDLTLPALVAVDRLELRGTPGARVTAPALVGPDAAAGTIVTVDANTGPAVVVAPALTDATSFAVTENTGPVAISAPLVSSVPSVTLTRNGGDLTGVLPTLVDAHQVNLYQHTGAEVDLLPALRTAMGLSVTDNASLRVLRLGAAGLVVTPFDTSLERNALLEDVSGLRPSRVARATCADNPALASCACEALLSISANPSGASCYGNAPDTCSADPADWCS